MKVLNSLSCLLLFTLISVFSCTSEVESFDKELLYGHWDIQSAQRDGHPTETLMSTFFEFDEEGKMLTNFNIDGNEISEKYEIQGQDIIQKGNPEVAFSVEKLEKEKLILLTKLMNYEFTLTLKKRN